MFIRLQNCSRCRGCARSTNTKNSTSRSHVSCPLRLFGLILELEAAPVVITSQCFLTRLPEQVLSKSTTRNSIIIKQETSLSKLRNQQLTYILKGTRVADVGHVETIDIGLIDPLNQCHISIHHNANESDKLTCSIMSATIAGVPTGDG